MVLHAHLKSEGREDKKCDSPSKRGCNFVRPPGRISSCGLRVLSNDNDTLLSIIIK